MPVYRRVSLRFSLPKKAARRKTRFPAVHNATHTQPHLRCHRMSMPNCLPSRIQCRFIFRTSCHRQFSLTRTVCRHRHQPCRILRASGHKLFAASGFPAVNYTAEAIAEFFVFCRHNGVLFRISALFFRKILSFCRFSAP